MKRIKYYDLLRVICFCFIIFYHILIQLSQLGICTYEQLSIYFENSNMHIATLAVAVFFMLSGAGLAYSTKKELKLKEFYKKRFLRILIPFYVVSILCFLFRAIKNKSVMGIIPVGFPRLRIIYTFLGMDEWITMHGIRTFSQGIGEWFLGALIILYLLFPLFRYFIIKNKRLFLTVATCVYIYVIYNYYSSVVPMHMSLILKGYEFILGMYFGMFLTEPKSKWMIISVPTVVFFFTCPKALEINQALMITILAVAFFVSFSYFEPWLNKNDVKIFDRLGKYSYELFLVHHKVIYVITPYACGYMNGKLSILLLFVVLILVMIIFTFIVNSISKRIINTLTKRIC